MARYCETLAAGAAPVAGSEVLTPEQARLERLWLGFRTREGMEVESLADLPRRQETLADMSSQGWLLIEDDRVSPTVQGFLLADRLPLLFTD